MFWIVKEIIGLHVREIRVFIICSLSLEIEKHLKFAAIYTNFKQTFKELLLNKVLQLIISALFIFYPPLNASLFPLKLPLVYSLLHYLTLIKIKCYLIGYC